MSSEPHILSQHCSIHNALLSPDAALLPSVLTHHPPTTIPPPFPSSSRSSPPPRRFRRRRHRWHCPPPRPAWRRCRAERGTCSRRGAAPQWPAVRHCQMLGRLSSDPATMTANCSEPLVSDFDQHDTCEFVGQGHWWLAAKKAGRIF